MYLKKSDFGGDMVVSITCHAEDPGFCSIPGGVTVIMFFYVVSLSVI